MDLALMAADIGGSLFIPGYDLYQCNVANNCTGWDWVIGVGGVAISATGIGYFGGIALKGAIKASKVAQEGTSVIGRVKDIQKLNKGEKSLLDRLSDQGSPKANWKQNSGVLRQEMGKGKPIRDASSGDTSGQFLNAERNLLESRGWTFDKPTNYWNPPK